MVGYSRGNPVLTFSILGIFAVSALLSFGLNAVGVDTGPVLDEPVVSVEAFRCVLLPVIGLGLAGTLFLMNRYGRGDDDTDVSDIY
jgi:hypothetical protein